jgi:hypothetical protein
MDYGDFLSWKKTAWHTFGLRRVAQEKNCLGKTAEKLPGSFLREAGKRQ